MTWFPQGRCGLYEKMEASQQDLLDVLLPLAIEARYPSYKEKLARQLTNEVCKDMMRQTEALLRWIKIQLSTLQNDTRTP